MVSMKFEITKGACLTILLDLLASLALFVSLRLGSFARSSAVTCLVELGLWDGHGVFQHREGQRGHFHNS